MSWLLSPRRPIPIGVRPRRAPLRGLQNLRRKTDQQKLGSAFVSIAVPAHFMSYSLRIDSTRLSRLPKPYSGGVNLVVQLGGALYPCEGEAIVCAFGSPIPVRRCADLIKWRRTLLQHGSEDAPSAEVSLLASIHLLQSTRRNHYDGIDDRRSGRNANPPRIAGNGASS